MSITSDIRSYADTAVSQGKQALDQAQAQFNDVTGTVGATAGEFVGTARENVSQIAEKAINTDAIRSAVEPYLAQAKAYSTTVTDQAQLFISELKSDKRVARLVDTAGSISGVVVETVQERVVKPVQSLTGTASKPAAKPAAKPAPKSAASAAKTTKPASKPAATKPASKPASKPTSKPTSKAGARKAPSPRATKA